MYRAKKFSVPQSFAAGVLLALQILHHGSDLIENVTFTKSWPLPSEKESLNRSKSAQNWSSFSISLLPKVTLPSLNFDHISNLGFIFPFLFCFFQDTFLATPSSPSHPSPLSQREQSQQVKMCQTYEKKNGETYTRQKLKKTERKTLKLTRPRSKSFSNSGPSSQQHHHQDPRSVLEACKNCKR